MRLKTSVQNKGRVFYTDVNGYQLVRRRTVDKLPLQGNFYPMPTSAVLQDKNTRLSLLSGQPLGVGALQEGIGVITFAIQIHVHGRGGH